jgi:hypothetical protein
MVFCLCSLKVGTAARAAAVVRAEAIEVVRLRGQASNAPAGDVTDVQILKSWNKGAKGAAGRNI